MKIIQIGCNNGSDDVFNFIEKHKEDLEKALLVDANSKALKEAEIKYSDKSNFCDFKNLAIIPIDIDGGFIKLYAPEEQEISGFSSVSRQHVVAHAHHENLIEFDVETKSLNKLIEEFGGDVDYLFIDTEGLDALNLFSLDYLNFNIKNIVFEYIHTDGIVKVGPRLNGLLTFLSQIGFKIEKDPDCEYNLIAKK